jgi:hypothetical protein
VTALDETYLGFIPILQDAMQMVNEGYKVMLLSSRSETDALVRNNHARTLSRIGFVSQEMKDLEYEFMNAIQERANEIGSNECIEAAQSSLRESTESAGQVIVYSARQWKGFNDALAGRLLYVVIDELYLISSLMESELISLFSYYNSVTNIFSLLYLYQTEIQIYYILFDLFVDEVLIVMKSYDNTTNQQNSIIFTSLNEAVEGFRTAGSLIVGSLRDC